MLEFVVTFLTTPYVFVPLYSTGFAISVQSLNNSGCGKREAIDTF